MLLCYLMKSLFYGRQHLDRSGLKQQIIFVLADYQMQDGLGTRYCHSSGIFIMDKCIGYKLSKFLTCQGQIPE